MHHGANTLAFLPTAQEMTLTLTQQLRILLGQEVEHLKSACLRPDGTATFLFSRALSKEKLNAAEVLIFGSIADHDRFHPYTEGFDAMILKEIRLRPRQVQQKG